MNRKWLLGSLLSVGMVPTFAVDYTNIILVNLDDVGSVSYTHLTLPTNREVLQDTANRLIGGAGSSLYAFPGCPAYQWSFAGRIADGLLSEPYWLFRCSRS